MTETKTNPVEELETKVEEISANLREFENQRARAIREGEEASRKLAALDEPRIALSPKAFRGDAQAAQKLEDLEDKADKLSWRLRLTHNATEEFTREIEEVKARLGKAEEAVHRERYREFAEKKHKRDSERDELAERLREVFREQEKLVHLMEAEVRTWSQDEANRVTEYARTGTRNWLKENFGRWLR